MTDPVFHHFLASLFEDAHIFSQIFNSETKIVIFIRKLCNQITVNEYVNILFDQVYD